MVNMDRSLTPYLKKDLPTKIALLTGPRQSGKTTLAKMLFRDVDYYNYDLAEDRLVAPSRHPNYYAVNLTVPIYSYSTS